MKKAITLVLAGFVAAAVTIPGSATAGGSFETHLDWVTVENFPGLDYLRRGY